MTTRSLPAFASEAEEASWWYDNREQLDEEFESAFKEGRVRRGGSAQRLAQAEGLQSVTLAPGDAMKAASLAEKKGVEVQAYLSELVHQAIQQEMERAA